MSDIYDNPTDQIEASVLVEGKPVEKDFPLTKILVEKKINDIPTATIHLIDGDPVVGDDSFKAATQITIGKPIEVKAGYENQTETIFKGIISGKNTEQDKDGNPTMILECTDKASALKEGKKTIAFYKKSDKDLVTQIISDQGLEKDISIAQGAKFEQLVQYDISDWDFILKRAQANGCILFPDDGKLVVGPPDVSVSATRTLKYGDTVKEQSLTVDDSNQPTSVKAMCWDPAQQKILEAVATEPTVNDQGDSTGKKLSENKGAEHILQTSTFLEQEVLKIWANAYLMNLRLTKISGRINTQGDPKLVPNSTVTLEGFGANYNGKGYIGAVKHIILPGDWETEIELGLPQNSTTASETSSESRVSILTGLQIGVVKKIHEDPENTYRVQVTLPSFPEIKEGIWARLSSPYAPKEKGWFFYPEIGDELIVGFVEGHPSHAIILGSLFSKKNAAPYTPDQDNSTKAIVTKGDLKIEFNDKDIITTISTPGGNEIVLTDKDEKITITDKKKNTITMSDSGIVIESKDKMELKAAEALTLKGKTVKIEGTNGVEVKGKDVKLAADSNLEGKGLNVKIKASTAIALEGSATAELKSGGNTAVKGAMLALN